MTKKKADLAEVLLEAQVAFMAAQLTGEALPAMVAEEVAAALEIAGRLKLHDLASRAAVKQSVRRLLIELAPGDAWAGLAVDLAVALHADKASDRATPAELVSAQLVERAVDQALSMQALREALIRGVIASPAYHSFASDLLYQGIRGYLAENVVTRNIPGAQSMMKLGRAALSRATPRLESAIEEGIKGYIARAVKLTSEHSVELLLGQEATRDLRRTALDLWHGISAKRIGSFRRQVSQSDAGRSAALMHQLWSALRGSEYMAALADATVDVLFDRYDGLPLSRLLADAGIGQELLAGEIHRHLAPAMKQLQKKKVLEPMLQRRLQGFYKSDAAREILQGGR